MVFSGALVSTLTEYTCRTSTLTVFEFLLRLPPSESW
jgi:hypothetical protein